MVGDGTRNVMLRDTVQTELLRTGSCAIMYGAAILAGASSQPGSAVGASLAAASRQALGGDCVCVCLRPPAFLGRCAGMCPPAPWGWCPPPASVGGRIGSLLRSWVCGVSHPPQKRGRPLHCTTHPAGVHNIVVLTQLGLVELLDVLDGCVCDPERRLHCCC